VRWTFSSSASTPTRRPNVDAVTFFDEDTPLDLINAIRPDVLVKGGDYTLEQIVGATEVMSWGGRVVINPIVPGFSTTGILEKIAKL
jgi:bifunctional ADP-heptose synthase (sugar kinase/adenylyltransferase)